MAEDRLHLLRAELRPRSHGRVQRIVKVRPDKDNPRSQGYACRKGLSIAHYQHHSDRLKSPLKRVGERFEAISWDQALDEIAAKLQAILAQHGPRSLAFVEEAAKAVIARPLMPYGCFVHWVRTTIKAL